MRSSPLNWPNRRRADDQARVKSAFAQPDLQRFDQADFAALAGGCAALEAQLHDDGRDNADRGHREQHVTACLGTIEAIVLQYCWYLRTEQDSESDAESV